MVMKLKRTGANCVMEVVVGEALAPLMEGPVPEGHEELHEDSCGVTCWMKGSKRRPSTDPRLLLSVLGCPLAPSPVFCSGPLSSVSICKDVPIEASSAQYIVQQYIAATGAMKLQNLIHNSYTSGKVKMALSQHDTTIRIFKMPTKSVSDGWFNLWQLSPNKWHMELTLEGSMVQAGSDGKIVWRCSPGLDVHAVKGPVSPLRRALQGIDPVTTANIFSNAHCVGETKIGDESCFALKLASDPSTLSERSDEACEIVQHSLSGYFSQRTGLLVHLKEKHVTRIHENGKNEGMYLDTTIESTFSDYKAVDGITLPYTGQSTIVLSKSGDMEASHVFTRIEEAWSINDIVFNVPGLSSEYFIPPADVRMEMQNDGLTLIQRFS
ncbi:hypothetical protein KP509_15G036600 [Ceratopteris richardii]|uniref:Uncharacterized protein n=1 Tax=Ceratopteris richardii TaxID=49495 RepID=A0A8T2T779_CERRI|nr:hypothetical protein KP509_15G036600 [Ceratopteris richardii]